MVEGVSNYVPNVSTVFFQSGAQISKDGLHLRPPGNGGLRAQIPDTFVDRVDLHELRYRYGENTDGKRYPQYGSALPDAEYFWKGHELQ